MHAGVATQQCQQLGLAELLGCATAPVLFVFMGYTVGFASLVAGRIPS